MSELQIYLIILGAAVILLLLGFNWFQDLRVRKRMQAEVPKIDQDPLLGDVAAVDRVRRELTDEDIAKVTATDHAWRGEPEAGDYADVAGYCASVKLGSIAKKGYQLSSGRYVGAQDVEDTDEDFATAMSTLTERLSQQMAEGAELERLIKQNLRGLGYEL